MDQNEVKKSPNLKTRVLTLCIKILLVWMMATPNKKYLGDLFVQTFLIHKRISPRGFHREFVYIRPCVFVILSFTKFLKSSGIFCLTLEVNLNLSVASPTCQHVEFHLVSWNIKVKGNFVVFIAADVRPASMDSQFDFVVFVYGPKN